MIDIKALAAFLTARLNEREEAARAAADGAGGGTWKVGGPAPCECCDELVTDTGNAVAAVDDRLSTHIARHDPARVLADIAAKRAIIEALESSLGSQALDAEDRCYECGTKLFVLLRLLALPDAGHPDYHQEWAA